MPMNGWSIFIQRRMIRKQHHHGAKRRGGGKDYLKRREGENRTENEIYDDDKERSCFYLGFSLKHV